MPLSLEQLQKAKTMLEEAADPLFIYHDDPDGLCSYLILSRFTKSGHGHMLKASPYLQEEHAAYAQEHKSDLIVVLDIAHIEEEFIAKANLPILWIDHHEPNPKKGTTYLNPRITDPTDNIPTSWLCHQITNTDEWIGMAGCVSDWVIPKNIDEFAKKHPEMISEPYTAQHLLFETTLGTLIKVLSFNLKGAHKEVKRSIESLRAIKTPEELLEHQSQASQIVWKKYEKTNREYTSLLNQANAARTNDPFLLFLYTEYSTSLTKDLSNEVYAKNPDKTIILAREKSDKIMFSLRSQKNLPPALEKALQGLDGKGGGHEHACGGWINAHDFPEMLLRLRRELE